MFAAERRQQILELVRANGAVSLRELAKAVSTSEVTVRRDIRALEADGLIDRRHGGAVMPGGLAREPGLTPREQQAAPERAAIAAVAARLVDEEDAIILGGGGTTLELARRLARMGSLTVFTNSLPAAQVLAQTGRVEIVMTGGTVQGSTLSLIGSAAEQAVSGLRVRRAFLSGNGLTPQRGLSSTNMLCASVDRAFVEAAHEVVVLCDHGKFGADTMFQTVPAERISHLVTDGGAARDMLDAFRADGVHVHVADLAVEQPAS